MLPVAEHVPVGRRPRKKMEDLVGQKGKLVDISRTRLFQPTILSCACTRLRAFPRSGSQGEGARQLPQHIAPTLHTYLIQCVLREPGFSAPARLISQTGGKKEGRKGAVFSGLDGMMPIVTVACPETRETLRLLEDSAGVKVVGNVTKWFNVLPSQPPHATP